MANDAYFALPRAASAAPGTQPLTLDALSRAQLFGPFVSRHDLAIEGLNAKLLEYSGGRRAVASLGAIGQTEFSRREAEAIAAAYHGTGFLAYAFQLYSDYGDAKWWVAVEEPPALRRYSSEERDYATAVAATLDYVATKDPTRIEAVYSGGRRFAMNPSVAVRVCEELAKVGKSARLIKTPIDGGERCYWTLIQE